jgi:N-acetylmuramoyl-L-alanine amidase
MPILFLYFVKVCLCSAILFVFYWLVLRDKHFHAYNRFYLIAILALSIFMPLLKINITPSNTTTQPEAIKIFHSILESNEITDNSTENNQSVIEKIAWYDIALVAYYIGIICMLFILLFNLYTVLKLYKKNNKLNFNGIDVVLTNNAKGTPFSFFTKIFWNNNIDINTTAGQTIFKHEMAHVQQKHSWDKLFINICLVVFWLNPIFWLIKKELCIIHEFIADKLAIKDGDTDIFARMILNTAYPKINFALTNHFFYSPIKRRLTMITKNKSPKVNYFSRIALLPITAIIVLAFSLKSTKPNSNTMLGKKIRVVLDAGHGGTDNGAKALDGTLEKNLTLQLVKKVQELNTNTNIEIILTRDNDVFQNPKEKAGIAASKNPDLFISVHIDRTPDNKTNQESKMSVYVAQDSILNSFKSKILAASVIEIFKADYGISVLRLPLQRKVGIHILKANNFPSVLIEAGNITNDKDLTYLKSENGQTAFARNLLKAIETYSTNAQGNISIPETQFIDTPPTNKAQANIEKTQPSFTKLYNLKMDIEDEDKSIEDAFFIINNKEIEFKDLKNKSVHAKIATIYKKGNKEAVKKYGEKANKNIFVFEDAVIKDKSVEIKLKNAIKKSTSFVADSIYFVDASEGQKSLSPVAEMNIKTAAKSSLNNNTLYILNGKVADAKLFNTISPELIKTIQVIKGKEAITKYGEKAKEGAIEVTTKKDITKTEERK